MYGNTNIKKSVTMYQSTTHNTPGSSELYQHRSETLNLEIHFV